MSLQFDQDLSKKLSIKFVNFQAVDAITTSYYDSRLQCSDRDANDVLYNRYPDSFHESEYHMSSDYIAQTLIKLLE